MKVAAKSNIWRILTMPVRLLYLLIWQPYQVVNLPFIPVVLLLLLCSTPLVIGLVQAGAPIGWLIVLLAWGVAAGFALAGMAKEGCALLLIAGLLALARPPRLIAGIGEIFRLPSDKQLFGALVACGVLLAFSIGVGLLIGRLPWRWPANLWASCAGVVVALLAMIMTGMDNSLTALALVIFAIALLPLVFGAVDSVLFWLTLLGFLFAVFGAVTVESRVLVPFVGLTGFVFAHFLRPTLQALVEWSVGLTPGEATLGVVRRATAPLIALLLIVAAALGGVLVAGISVLPGPLFLLVCWFSGLIGFGPYETNWKNMLLVLLVPIIGVETQGLTLTAIGMLVTLVGGYRLLEFIFFAPISAWGCWISAGHADQWLRRLPPWYSEHGWLPLPGHAALLRAALQAGSPVALQAVARMRILGQPGLDHTLLAGLPPFLHAQLLGVQTPQEIAAHAGAPTSLLVQTLLQAVVRQNIGYRSNQRATHVRLRFAAAVSRKRPQGRALPLISDMAVVLPGLHAVAQVVAQALGPHVDARTLAIDRAWFDLRSMPSEAIIQQYMTDVPSQPTLADAVAALDQLAIAIVADDGAVSRWQPIITQWRTVLKGALESVAP